MSNYTRKSPAEVEAIQLKEAIFDAEGQQLAGAGEWIIVDGFGQYYMKDEDFKREFIRKGPQKEIVVQKEVEVRTITVPSQPVIIKEPCPDYWRWPRPWWDRGIVWCSSQGYSATHSTTSDKLQVN